MTTKKILMCILTLSMGLAGCGTVVLGAENTSDSHTHTAGEWVADLENHWQVCNDCGEVFDTEAHTMNESEICEVCSKAVFDYGDGTYGVISYDEQGALSEDAGYDADGELIYRYRYVFEYYEDGNVKSEKDYVYDPAGYGEEEILMSESVYLYCENTEFGEVYQAESTTYYEDGSSTYMECAENGEIIRSVEYDAEGNESSVSRYEYERDEQGYRTYMALYVDEVLSYEEYYMSTPECSEIVTKQVSYDENGEPWSTSEYKYEFDDEGNLLYQAAYMDEVLDWETFYEADEEGFMYLAKETDYDENGELVSEINYDAYGNEI